MLHAEGLNCREAERMDILEKYPFCRSEAR